jgi:hypothetical protein
VRTTTRRCVNARVHARSVVIGWFVVVISIGRLEAGQTVGGAYEAAITRALRLLPKVPAKILVVDATEAARAVDAHGRKVEAFVRHGENVVYLIAQGATLRGAQNGRGIFDYALATLIWHETAHLGGADARGAQRQEEELWMQFVATGRVDANRGLNYLALLKKRH